MLTLRKHNVEDYATLRNMDTTDVAVLDETDRDCLDELGQYLVAAGAWRRFAIWLLHKHFELTTREILIEFTVAAPRGTLTAPVKCYLTKGLSVTAMRFETESEFGCGTGVIGMEFANSADFGSAAPVNSADEAILTGIADRLRAHGKTERFGVRLIRNPLGLLESEVLVETCDMTRRTLQCGVFDRDRVHMGDTVETSWQWKPSPHKNGSRVKQYCLSQCAQDSNGAHFTMGHTIYPDS